MKGYKPEILVVDDDPHIRNSLFRLFKLKGFSVVLAKTGKEAIDLFETRRIGLVISDQRMPGMTGIDLMSNMKLKHPNIVRILLTAFSEETILKAAINEGEVFRFFTKPWDENVLINCVSNGLDRHTQLIQREKQATGDQHWYNIETVMALAEAIELKDHYTKGHCSRVTYYALQIALAVGLAVEDLPNLIYGALLHDCGKIGVSENILLSPGKLSVAEQKIMKCHSAKGYELTNTVSHLRPASLFIRQHHERWDGTGYPDGLSEKQTHICSRMITIADAFDAMTSNRPYQRGMSFGRAKKILTRNKGRQFDPDLVDVFIGLLNQKGAAGMLSPFSTKNNLRRTIVFLNDEPNTLRMLEQEFIDEPYRLMTASSIEDALALLTDNSVDIIVCAQATPMIMTDVEFFKIIKQKHPETLRIMLSGNTNRKRDLEDCP